MIFISWLDWEILKPARDSGLYSYCIAINGFAHFQFIGRPCALSLSLDWLNDHHALFLFDLWFTFWNAVHRRDWSVLRGVLQNLLQLFNDEKKNVHSPFMKRGWIIRVGRTDGCSVDELRFRFIKKVDEEM